MKWFGRLKRGIHGPSVERPLGSLAPRAAAKTSSAIPRYSFSDERSCLAAIGDLHGRIDLLNRLTPELDRRALDPARRLVEIYLGDFVDRGSNPKAVLDYLIERRKLTDRTVVCLAGNHEEMLLAALDDDAHFKTWLGFGGESTLMSYGLSPRAKRGATAPLRAALRAAMPQAHVDFLKSLSLFYRHREFFFVHAGVRPGGPLESQGSRDLLWIREPFLKSTANLGAVIVHGHTPTADVVFRPNRIGVDTGAYRTGVLTCLFVSSTGIVCTDTRNAVGDDRQ